MKRFAVRQPRFAVLLLLVFSLLLAACENSSAVSNQRLYRPIAPGDEIVVAAVWPYAAGGTLYWEGIQMALEEINSRGGAAGRPIRVAKFDDHASVTEGMAIAQIIVGDPDIFAVIGHRNSFVAIPAADVYDRAGIVYIAPSATNPTLTRNGYKLTFRTIPSDIAIGQQMAEHIASQGHRRIAIAYSDDAYGRGLASAFEDAAHELGLLVVDRLSHFGDLQSTRSTVKKWRALDYDSIFVADVLPRAAEVIRLLRQAGAQPPIYGGDGLDGKQLWAIAGETAEGVVFGSVFDASDPDPEVQRFVQAFEQKHGQPPDAWAAQGYDALRLFAYAVESADEVTPTSIVEALRHIPSWRGVTGPHSFDESGEVIGKPVVRKVMQSGEFVFLGK